MLHMHVAALATKAQGAERVCRAVGKLMPESMAIRKVKEFARERSAALAKHDAAADAASGGD